MNIFTNSIKFKIADVECFHFTPLAYNVFRKRKDANIRAKILRSCDQEFIVVCYDSGDTAIKIFDQRYCDFFKNVEKGDS